MKPENVSKEDWEEALVTGAPPSYPVATKAKKPVHVFLQRGEKPPFIFLLENGCLVRGKLVSVDAYNIRNYIENNKDRYLGIGYPHGT